MKLEKFNASSMADVMAKIKKKMGPDAVIFSQKKTDKGLEVVAGLIDNKDLEKAEPEKETEELSATTTTEPNTFIEKIKQLDSSELISELHSIEKQNIIIKKLKQLKFPYDFCEDFAKTYASSCEIENILNNQMIIKILLSKILIEETELVNIKRICTLIGPTGIGKSTSVAKLARRFASRFGSNRLGIISMDFQRIITKNQFYHFGKLLNIHVEYAKNIMELKEAIQILDDKRLILIDTAGVNQNDNKKIAELFERFSNDIHGISSYIVLPCNLQSDILDDVVKKFKMPHTSGCILTKTDEAKSLAPCLSIVMKHRLPIAYCCNGQNIVKDIYRPSRAELINAVFQGEKHDKRADVSV